MDNKELEESIEKKIKEVKKRSYKCSKAGSEKLQQFWKGYQKGLEKVIEIINEE